MRIIICDDEEKQISNLKALKRHPPNRALNENTSATSWLSWILLKVGSEAYNHVLLLAYVTSKLMFVLYQ